MKFEDITFYNTSLYHYNLHDKQNCRITVYVRKNMIPSILKSLIKDKILLALWLLIIFLCGLILYLSPQNHLLSLVSLLPKGYTAKITLVLILLSIGLAISLFILNKKYKEKINLHEFTFVNPPGYFTHPKYQYNICKYCLIKSNLISPVSQHDENTWYCDICENRFPGGKGDAFNLDDF